MVGVKATGWRRKSKNCFGGTKQYRQVPLQTSGCRQRSKGAPENDPGLFMHPGWASFVSVRGFSLAERLPENFCEPFAYRTSFGKKQPVRSA